jgi:hypothetical protein
VVYRPENGAPAGADGWLLESGLRGQSDEPLVERHEVSFEHSGEPNVARVVCRAAQGPGDESYPTFVNSTRRLFALPSGVVLASTGLVAP